MRDDPLPPAWDDPIARQLYDGAHAGLAAVDAPLPEAGIRVIIAGLRVSPTLVDDPDPAVVRAVGETIRLTVVSTLETWWRGLRWTSPADSTEAPRRITDAAPD